MNQLAIIFVVGIVGETAAYNAAAFPGEYKVIRFTGTELLRNSSDGGAWATTLVLLHSTPVNSRESAHALEIWRNLSRPLDGLMTLAVVDCDEYTTECSKLGVQLYPQVLLFSVGDVIHYAGPMTMKSIFLFATNHVVSPVAQIDRHHVDWWLGAQPSNRTCVILFQDNSKNKIPLAFTAFARSLGHSHAFAEVSVVPQVIMDKFKLSKLPAVVSSPCKNNSESSARNRMFQGNVTRETLRTFLGQSEPNPGNSGRTAAEELSRKQYVVEGVSHLNVTSAASLCPDFCIIIFTNAGTIEEETIRHIQLLKDFLNKRRNSGSGKLHIPKLVWMSRMQVMYSVLLALSGRERISLAVWKVKRNRVAIHRESLDSSGMVLFVDDVLTGTSTFQPLTRPVEELVAEFKEGREVPRGRAKEEVEYVDAGHVTWTHPTNMFLERQHRKQPSRMEILEEQGGILL